MNMSIEGAPSMQPPQRLSRRMAETCQLGSALQGLTGADLACQHH